jgi:zinc-ribbon family
MVFLFGTRTTNRAYFSLGHHACPNCGNHNTLFAETGSSYFHIFFFPFASTGRKITVKCGHCQKTFSYEKLTPEIKKDIDDREAILKKDPLWHSCGCSLILLSLFIWGVATCSGYVFKDDDETAAIKAENKPYEEMYQHDLELLTTSPDPEKDSVAYAVKDYIDYAVTDEMNKGEFKYLSKINGKKLLILMEVPDMKKVAAGERSQLITLIREALNGEPGAIGKQLYISIEGQWNTLLVYTPTHSDLNGRFASAEYVYDFYKPELLKDNNTPETGKRQEEPVE